MPAEGSESGIGEDDGGSEELAQEVRSNASASSGSRLVRLAP